MTQYSGLQSWERTNFCGFKTPVCDDFYGSPWKLFHHLKLVFLNWDHFAPLPGTLGNIWKHFWLSQPGAVTGIRWVEAREAANVL